MRARFKFLLLSITILLVGANAPTHAQISSSPQAATILAPAPLVYILPIRDDVEQSMEYLARRGVKEANAANADLLVLHLDTNGGRGDSMEKIMRTLGKFHRPEKIYAFVDTKAISAGAFIASAARTIYMAPGSVIGGATPVMLSQSGGGVQELPASYEQKVFSVYRAIGRAIAEKNGHNPEVFDAMIDPKAELVIEGKKVRGKTEGRALTLTATEAAQAYGQPPRPLLSAGTVASLDLLVAALAGPDARVVTVEPTGFERLARGVTMISSLLLMAGIVCGYLEFKTPGFGIFGIASAACFLVFFCGHYVAGLSGYGPALIFVAGVALILFEVIVFPGVLLPILAGLFLAFGALLWAMMDRYPQETGWPSLVQLEAPLAQLGLACALALGAIAVAARFLPERVFASKLDAATLRREGDARPAPVRVGQEGVALTLLRPSGTARFGGAPVDVVTEGDLIEPGTPVVVIALDGVRVVVAPVEKMNED